MSAALQVAFSLPAVQKYALQGTNVLSRFVAEHARNSDIACFNLLKSAENAGFNLNGSSSFDVLELFLT